MPFRHAEADKEHFLKWLWGEGKICAMQLSPREREMADALSREKRLTRFMRSGCKHPHYISH